MVSSIMIDSCRMFYAYNVTWNNLLGTTGAGIYFINNLIQTIHYEKTMLSEVFLQVYCCKFYNLKGWAGAAMFLENVDNLQF